MRRQLDETGTRPEVRMWLYPWLTYLTIGFICAVLVLMLVQEGHRLELGLSLGLAGVILAVGLARGRRHSARDAGRGGAAEVAAQEQRATPRT